MFPPPRLAGLVERWECVRHAYRDPAPVCAQRSSLSHGDANRIPTRRGDAVVLWCGPAPTLSRSTSLDDLKIIATHWWEDHAV